MGVRVETALRRKGQKWLKELNRGRKILLTETDLIRGLIEYGIRHRVPWETPAVDEAERRVKFWDAVNAYAKACGGKTGAATVSGARMRAVVAVEQVLEELWR